MKKCAGPGCDIHLVKPVRGPMPDYCSTRCRVRAMRVRRAAESERVQPAVKPAPMRKPTAEDVARLIAESASLEASFRFAADKVEFRLRPLCARMADAIGAAIDKEGLR